MVSGCSSNTLGLSNLFSEIVESVANLVEDPFEVISSEDLLSRIEKFNKLVEQTKEMKNNENPNSDWDWRDAWLLIGSDVVSLFPRLTAENTAKIVREQVRKSPIEWKNIDVDWLRIYIHLNRTMSSDLSSVSALLPEKKKGRRGKESGMHSNECLQRHIETDNIESCWTWPKVEIGESETKELLSVAMEIAVKFFWGNFTYTFGGQDFIQEDGGSIGARLTMCISRLIMQAWSEKFSKILSNNKIMELLKGIYVDDGRSVVSKIENNARFSPGTKLGLSTIG